MAHEEARPVADAAGQEGPAGLSKGATIGRYVVLGLLGRGGMGEVYAAYDPELDRKIAVKLLRTRAGRSDDSTQGRTRLLREAQAIAKLSHPNVVVVYDVGTFRGSVFVAMEFVEGPTVGYWLHAQPHTWRDVLNVFLSAGRGLVAAHEADLVHRDFKPDNVMITKDGQVRVMDFGLARQLLGDDDDEPPVDLQNATAAQVAKLMADTADGTLDPEATADLAKNAAEALPTSSSGGYLRVKLTQTGAILGTPAYMAPEQFAGSRGDARADQFSFCVALYEGLYGRRPFEGDSMVSLMANVVGGAVAEPPPQARVPAWLRKVLLRGLRPDPDTRFPSMAALLAALGRDPAARRRRWIATAAGGALVVALAGGAQRFSAGQRAVCAGGPSRAATAWGPPQRDAVKRAFRAAAGARGEQAFATAAGLFDQYVGRWTAAYTEACEATHARGEQSAEVLDLRMTCLNERLSNVRALTDVFSHANAGVVDNAVAAAGSLPALDRCADIKMLKAVIKPPDDPAKRAQVTAVSDQVAKVNALAMAGQCDQANAVGGGVLQAATKLGYLPVKADILFALGRLGDTCTDPTKAIEQLEEAVYAAEESHHDEIAISASSFLSHEYTDRARDVHLSGHWIRHAEAILARFPGHPLLEAWVVGQKANVLYGQGNYDEGLPGQRRALALTEAGLGPMHRDVAIQTMNLALILFEMGRTAEAEPVLQRSIDLFTKVLGPNSAQVAVAKLDQCELLTALGRYDEAQAAIERALTIWKDQNAGPFYIGYGLLDLGRLQLAKQQPQPARATLERAIELLGTSDPQVSAEADFALARALWATPHDRGRATELARKARVAIGDATAGAKKKSAEIDAWLNERRPG